MAFRAIQIAGTPLSRNVAAPSSNARLGTTLAGGPAEKPVVATLPLISTWTGTPVSFSLSLPSEMTTRSVGTSFVHPELGFNFRGSRTLINIALDPKDDTLLREIVALKDRWPSLQVTIAVGGWAFSMEDPTKTIFTQMISTQARRATFITSVKSFITKYSLDGVDIDLEYPAAMERAAPAAGEWAAHSFIRDIP